MSHNKRCYLKKINKSAAQGSRRVDLMFKQASLKAFTSDFDVCDKDLGIDSVSSATCIESIESVHQPNLSATVSTSACETNPDSESSTRVVTKELPRNCVNVILFPSHIRDTSW